MTRALLAAVILSLAAVAPVAAAVANDTVAGATVVAVGDTVTQDTTGADQTDPAETALNEFCGAPVVEHGVWFTITPTAAASIALDTSTSDYSAGMMVFAGAPTADGVITCGPGFVVFDGVEGTQYNILVFGDGLTESTSGNLVFSVSEAAPPPELSVTIDRIGTVDRNGVARITGTVTCTSQDDSGIVFDVFGDVTQRVGRFLVRGFFDTFLDAPCDGGTIAWEGFVQGDNGVFSGGKAAVVTIAFGCADLCSEGYAEATVQLRRSGR